MTRNEVFDCILAATREVDPVVVDFIKSQQPKPIESETCFVDLGINSIDFIEIVTEVMERLDVDIPVDKFCNVFRIRELVDLFYQELSDPPPVRINNVA